MTAKTVAASYALAVGTACPLAFGLGKVSPSKSAYPSINYYVILWNGVEQSCFVRRAAVVSHENVDSHAL